MSPFLAILVTWLLYAPIALSLWLLAAAARSLAFTFYHRVKSLAAHREFTPPRLQAPQLTNAT